ncbi:MAG: CHASE2 domain-containing protein, partial [Rhizomicrobium sp.]
TLHRTYFDMMQRFFPRPYQPTPIRTLLISSHGAEALPNWIPVLKREGVAAIVLTDEIAARTAPAFQAAGMPTIRAVTLTNTPARQPEAQAIDSRLTHGIRWSGQINPFAKTPDFSGVDFGGRGNHAGDWLAASNLIADDDGVVRHVPVVLRLHGQLVATITAQVWRLVNNHAPLTLYSNEGASLINRIGIRAAEVGSFRQTIRRDGGNTIDYSWSQYARMLPASTLLPGGMKPGSLRGAIVFIGMSDKLVKTPIGLRQTATVQADAAENLLLGSALHRPHYLPPSEVLALLLLGSIGIMIFWRYGLHPLVFYGLAIVVLAAVIAWSMRVYLHQLTDPRGFILGQLLTIAGCALAGRYCIFRQRRQIALSFAGRLPPATIRILIRTPEFSFEPEIRKITYLSCGWRLVGVPAPDRMAATRQRIQSTGALGQIVLQHGGMLDAVTGDEITAVWNAPLNDPDPVVQACEAASAMLDVLAVLNDGDDAQMRAFGIGISNGEGTTAGFTTTAGNWGYSVGGLCVRRAKLLRQVSYRYGYSVLTCDAIEQGARHQRAFLEVDFMPLGPSAEPIHIYAMPGHQAMRSNPRLRAQATFHDEIFVAMRARQWAKARALIAQCRKLSGASQSLYDLHLARIDAWELDPPGPDWDGAFRSPTS